jgi:hypothetical protein
VRPRLWWRDDDAKRPHPALDRLLGLAAAHAAPLTLAIIPAANVYALAARLTGVRGVTIAQHGVDHRNRRAPGRPCGENPIGACAGPIAARIAAARERMTQAGLAPRLYAPPWNRIDRALPAALRAVGYETLSAWGEIAGERGGPCRLDVHVEFLRWTRPPRGLSAARIDQRLREALAQRRERGALAAPIGLLTHHADFDQIAWRRLAELLAWAARAFDWSDLPAASWTPPA